MNLDKGWSIAIIGLIGFAFVLGGAFERYYGFPEGAGVAYAGDTIINVKATQENQCRTWDSLRTSSIRQVNYYEDKMIAKKCFDLAAYEPITETFCINSGYVKA